MKLYNKITLIFLKYLPVLLLFTCILKLGFSLCEQSQAIKITNVILNASIAIGLYAVSFSFNFCKTYKGLLSLALYGYLNYLLYLLFDVNFNNPQTFICFGTYIVFCIFHCIKYYFFKKKGEKHE